MIACVIDKKACNTVNSGDVRNANRSASSVLYDFPDKFMLTGCLKSYF